jgi:hypothetical protein
MKPEVRFPEVKLPLDTHKTSKLWERRKNRMKAARKKIDEKEINMTKAARQTGVKGK